MASIRFQAILLISFFSPDGKLVHKSGSYQKVEHFIAIASMALIPGKEYDDPFVKYHQLLKDYKSGNKNYELMPYMIEKGNEALEYEDVKILIKDYYTWLPTQPKEKDIY